MQAVDRFRRFGIAALLALLTACGSGETMAADKQDPIVAFAHDFSDGDAAIVEKARGFVAKPPSDDETIGFYTTDDEPPRTRAYLATVNLLDTAEKLYAVEDKYTTEIFAIWQEAGVIDAKTLPPAAKALFGPLVGDAFPDPETPDAAAYRTLAWNSYAQATQELEQHIAARGKVLLSIDATDGDTMFFALVPPQVAERWRDKALSDHGGYRAGVRAPMWDRFWAHLGYAMRGTLVEDDRKGLPPGTGQRVEAIPLEE